MPTTTTAYPPSRSAPASSPARPRTALRARARELVTGRFRWLTVLVAGAALYGAEFLTLLQTRDVILLPSLLLVGAAIVPVTFTTFVQTTVRDRGPSFRLVLVAAVIGGFLGTTTASVLETETIRALGSLPLLLVGLIEESAKLLVPALLLLWRPWRLVDGLVLGVAVGSGFAALETMGYAFVDTVRNSGELDPITHLLLTRSVLAPGGHAAWTGIGCVALFAVRGSSHRRLAWLRFGAVLAAIVGLHTIWDSWPATTTYVLVGGVSFLALLGVAWWLGRATQLRPATGSDREPRPWPAAAGALDSGHPTAGV
jgi:protease PrsW